MRIKLQSPTGTGLTAYNPILPPGTISQIMLLANPTKVSLLPGTGSQSCTVYMFHAF